MFKPHYGICICHGLKRLIVVKKGYCHEGNRNAKLDRNTQKVQSSEVSDGYSSIIRQKSKTQKKIYSSRKPTGELALFQEMWEEELDKCDPQCPTCWCCSKPLGWDFSVSFFSHLLAKGTYGLFRLFRRNIWIKCNKCHDDWDKGDRTQTKFASARKETEALKQLYYDVKKRDQILL